MDARTVYVFEFKTHGTAQEALQQIVDRNYAVAYDGINRKTVKVGVVFDLKSRSIKEWAVEE